MKYRGFDPRTRPLRWGLFVSAVAGVLVITGPGAAHAVADLAVARSRTGCPGTRRGSAGLLAYGALTASVLYGLLLSTGILDALAHRAVSFTLHQDLAAIGLALTLVHGGAADARSHRALHGARAARPVRRPVPAGVGRRSASCRSPDGDRRLRQLLAAHAGSARSAGGAPLHDVPRLRCGARPTAS